MYEAFIGLTRFLINLHTLNETDLENIHRKYFDESSFQIKIPSSVQINTDAHWSADYELGEKRKKGKKEKLRFKKVAVRFVLFFAEKYSQQIPSYLPKWQKVAAKNWLTCL